jgi:hypothetical protein
MSRAGANAKPAPGSPTADRLPIYEVDPSWLPTLPNDWILGDIRGLFVDNRDHLWVIHMPSSLTPQEIGAAVTPPKGSLRLTYLDVPALVRDAGPSDAQVRIHVSGGPTLGFLLRARSEVERPLSTTIDVKDQFRIVDLGWVVGAGTGGWRRPDLP